MAHSIGHYTTIYRISVSSTNNIINEFGNIKGNKYFVFLKLSNPTSIYSNKSLFSSVPATDSIPEYDPLSAKKHNNAEVIKSFEILRTKPPGYRDTSLLRTLSANTLASLSIFKSQELCDIAEILAYVKYRNIVLMQGITESLYWSCKVRRISIKDISRFLKSCSILRYIPSLKHLNLFFGEFNSRTAKQSIGDYLRMLQFLVHTDLYNVDVFMDTFTKFYTRCRNNLGCMTHKQIASFGQTQLIIDETDQEMMNKLCLNFNRDVHNSNVSQFLMLSNSVLRSVIRTIPPDYDKILKYYLDKRSEHCHPKVVKTGLAILSKFYCRDTECLNKIGSVVARNLSSYSNNEISTLLNHLAALSYKHKELICSITKSIQLSDKSEPSLELLGSICNLISKVEYQHIQSIKTICEHSSAHFNNLPSIYDKELDSIPSQSSSEPVAHTRTSFRETDTSVPGKIKRADLCIMTNDMILNELSPDGYNFGNVGEKRGHKTSRRLIYNFNREEIEPILETNFKIKVMPLNTDVRKLVTLKDYTREFMQLHFNGRHPASRRLNFRTNMRKQTRMLKKKAIYTNSKLAADIFLETNSSDYSNKAKRSNSKYIHSGTFYLNECRILKRCFLAPFTYIFGDNVKLYIESLTRNNEHRHLTLLKYVLKVHKPSDDLTSLVDYNCQSIIDQYVDNETPIHLDNKFLVNPIISPSLRNKRTKRIYYKLRNEHNHSTNDLTKYNVDNNIWKTTEQRKNIVKCSGQSGFSRITGIITSLSKIHYLPFDLLLKTLNGAMGGYSFNVTNEEDSLKLVRSFVHFTDSIKTTLLNDRSGLLANMFISIMWFVRPFTNITMSSSNDFIKNFEANTKVSTNDIYKILRLFNTITFIKYFNSTVNYRKADARVIPVATYTSDIGGKARIVEPLYRMYTIISKRFDSIPPSQSHTSNTDEKSLVMALDNIIYTLWLIRLDILNIDTAPIKKLARLICRVGYAINSSILDRVRDLNDSTNVHVMLSCLKRYDIIQKRVEGSSSSTCNNAIHLDKLLELHKITDTMLIHTARCKYSKKDTINKLNARRSQPKLQTDYSILTDTLTDDALLYEYFINYYLI